MSRLNFFLSAYSYPYTDSDDEVEKIRYSKQAIKDLVDFANHHNLTWLGSVSFKYKTYLNEHQVHEVLEKELPLLKNEKINKDLIESIERIGKLVIHEGYQFLKFEPCE